MHRSSFLLFANGRVKFFTRKSLLYNTSNKTNGIGVASKGSFSEEDKEDLIQERELRNQFTSKLYSAKKQDLGTDFTPDGFDIKKEIPSSKGFHHIGGNAESPSSTLQSRRYSYWRLVFFFSSIFFILIMNRIKHIYSVKTVDFREFPLSTGVIFYLYLFLLSPSQRSELQREYTSALLLDANLSFDHFLQKNYPNLFSGQLTSQSELIAGLCASILTSEHPYQVIQIIYNSCVSTKNTCLIVDNIMQTLLREFPQAFVHNARE